MLLLSIKIYVKTVINDRNNNSFCLIKEALKDIRNKNLSGRFVIFPLIAKAPATYGQIFSVNFDKQLR